MDTLCTTGLCPIGSAKVANGLQLLLADYHIFYMNVRGYHWNVKGKPFFQLHEKFESYYVSIAEKIDEIAERLVQLDAVPVSSFSACLKMARLKEENANIASEEMVQNLLKGFKHLIAAQREILKEADASDDVATASLLEGHITEQEKTVWMLSAWLS